MMQSKPAFLRSRWISSSRLGNAGWVLGLRIYYWLKPALPLRLRLILRRWWAKQQLAAYAEQWPILDIAKEAPKKWLGWPEEKEFAFVLTHDVESQLGLDRVKALAEAEMAAGFRSSFNFIPEGPYQVPPELRQWLVETVLKWVCTTTGMTAGFTNPGPTFWPARRASIIFSRNGAPRVSGLDSCFTTWSGTKT